MTYEEIKNNEEINSYIRQADASLVALGFTEHSFAHVTLVAEKAGYILEALGYPARPWSWQRSRAICTTSAILSTASTTASPAR